MDKMFSSFEDYVNLVDDCDEDIFVSEHRFENEDLHENSEFMHDSSETRDKSVVGEEDIVILFLSQYFPNLVAKNVIRAYALKNGRNTSQWEITSLELNHNHDVVSPSKMSLIKRERHVTAAQKNLIKSFYISGIVPRQQMNIFGKMHGGEEQVGFHAQHLRNVVRDFRKDNLGVNDAQAGLDLLHRLEEESGGIFFIRTLIDKEGRLKYLLRVDLRSLLSYKNFGDVVAFDTTYRINRYAMLFVPFTGVNHHYQSFIFEFALMRDELKTTFEWILGTWLEAVEGKAPLAIISDQDRAMAGEIQSQLPNMTHLLCLWHISNKFLEKLSTYYAKEEFKGDFNNCIYHSLTKEIFEERWNALILKYKSENNTWLQLLYNLKHKWIDVYTRNFFRGSKNNIEKRRNECLF
ncbi:protein FAR1-RELATED SEQUENCE 5-like [Apium graveolens]|uniref:protein FAR1-RELATED SEQUENCE 5-like n=1 Tax=Apium graveolens TaxID=4045 RepID=UPI003D79C624